MQALLHKCINNGMATIQIKVPPHDIQLSEVISLQYIEEIKRYYSIYFHTLGEC